MLVVRHREADQRRGRSWIAVLLGYGELVLETAVAFALAVGGIVLLSSVVYGFVRDLGEGPVLGQVLDLLGGLLLVFIFTELISTIRVVIARRALQVEPFLIVGIVAAIRRLIVVSAEAENVLGTPRFRDVMVEIGVLAGAALVLGTTVLLLRLARRAGGNSTGPADFREPEGL
jgi:uncharacterized membrane protein (DUF373 family)